MDSRYPRPFLTAEWRYLLMLNYEVDPALLKPLLPAGTTLDLWQDRALVSMVGFLFLNTRVRGLPIPFHRNFEEVNLRFYVRRTSAEGTSRGVVFVKEIVPKAMIAWVARWVYNENYVALPMSHVDEIGQNPEPRVTYRWESGGRSHHMGVRVVGAAYVPDEASEETFITEHYWGYVRQRAGHTVEYQVEHPQWKVWRASEAEFECDVGALYGAEFAPFLAGAPSSAFLAQGSAVTVRRGRRLGS